MKLRGRQLEPREDEALADALEAASVGSVDSFDLVLMANGESPVPEQTADAALLAIRRIQKRRVDDRELAEATLEGIIKRYGEDEDYRD